MSESFSKYGFSERDRSRMLMIFSSCRNLERAILYGSRAKGNFKPFSDVDITLEGEGLTRRDLLHLSAAFEESALPYIFDLSLYRNIENEALLSHIARRGVEVYRRGCADNADNEKLE